MNWSNRFSQLIFAALLFTLISCAHAAQSSASYPNPTTATPVFIGKGITDTPKPISTRANFEIDHLSNLPSEDFLNYSEEGLFKILVSQWLEKYKTGVIPSDPIKDYRIDRVTMKQAEGSKIMALIDFSIHPIEEFSNWSVLIITHSNPNDPWDHLQALFTIYQEEGYIWLKLVPGGGL